MSSFFPTVLLDRLIESRTGFAEMLEDDDMHDDAARVRCEVKRLENLKIDAENWDGPVAQVAVTFGYTPGHVYTLIREGLIENVAAEGEEMRVRYMDVLNHRLKDVPSGDPPASSPKNNSTRKTNVTARPTRKNGPRVKVTVGA